MTGWNDVGALEEQVSMDRPSAARMYDYYLGGSNNFPADREVAERILAVYPDIAVAARVNRMFLRRAVTFLARLGIDQFLDIGSGIPTAGNVHEVVHRINPAAHVAYVDHDPIAVQHSSALLQSTPTATAVQADARRPEEILTHPDVQRLIDLDRPVAVLLCAVLHFVPDDLEAYALVRTLCDGVAPGSYIAVSHNSREGKAPAALAEGERTYSTSTTSVVSRTRAQMLPFFESLEMVEPGLVYAPRWRPEGPDDLWLDEPERSINIVGVARKA